MSRGHDARWAEGRHRDVHWALPGRTWHPGAARKTDANWDLGGAGNGAVHGFAGPVAAIRRQFATLGSTASGQALTHPSTRLTNMV